MHILNSSARCVMIVTGEQLRAARSIIRAQQEHLAKWAGVSVETVKRLERTDGEVSANISTVTAIMGRLAAAGVEFIGGSEPGVKRLVDEKMTPAEFELGFGEHCPERLGRISPELTVESFDGGFLALKFNGREIGTAAQHSGGIHFRPRIVRSDQMTPGDMFEDWARRAHAAAAAQAAPERPE